MLIILQGGLRRGGLTPALAPRMPVFTRDKFGLEVRNINIKTVTYLLVTDPSRHENSSKCIGNPPTLCEEVERMPPHSTPLNLTYSPACIRNPDEIPSIPFYPRLFGIGVNCNYRNALIVV